MENALVLVQYPLNFRAHPSSKHQPDHFVVAHERPEWVLKCGRPVFFNEEMSNPRGSVAGNQTQKKQPPASGRNEVHDTSDANSSAEQVE